MVQESASMTSVRIDDDLLSLFQDVVRRHAGKLKGAQSDAVNEAVLLWLAHKGETIAISLTVDGRERVIAPRDFVGSIQKALEGSTIRCQVRFLGVGSYESLEVQLLDLAIVKFGLPREIVVEDLDQGEILARIDLARRKSTKEWVRELYELEDGTHGKVSLKVLWEKVMCHIRPGVLADLSTVHKIKGFETFEVDAGIQSRSR
jgi:hypothetical protein